MAEPVRHSKYTRINVLLKRIGFCLLLLALLAALIDLLDWQLRKTTTDVSSYTFTGTTITFLGMTDGSISITTGPAGRVTLVHRLTEGIRKIKVSERARGDTLAIQEAGGCNTRVSLALFGSCVSQYQIQAPVGTTVVAGAGNGKTVRVTVGSKDVQHAITVKCDNGTISFSR